MYLNRRPVQALDEAIPEPQPQEDFPEPWDDFMERLRRQELERDRAREALRAAREAGERDREMLGGEAVTRRIALETGRRVIYDPVTQQFREV